MTAFTLSIADVLARYENFHATVENTPEYRFSVEGQLTLPFEQTDSFIRQLHAAIGMCGESGEISDLFKKQLFGKHAGIDNSRLKDELGDIFWYFFLMLRASSFTLDDILEGNILKLAGRYDVSTK